MARWHLLNAKFLALFLTAHLLNHLCILLGITTHLRVLETFRHVYRLPGLEHLIYAAFTAQIILGLALAYKRGRPQGTWAVAQVVSGLYLVFFLAQHLFSSVATRIAFRDIDTNSYWAAAVVSRSPFVWYFAPYYALAITALFTHVACALRFRIWPAPPHPLHKALPFIGALFSLLIVAGFTGVFAPINLPAPYQTFLVHFWTN